ncbi:MAG: methyltransferase [bacterium]|nr:methyltransferase [bacterium]
MFEAEIHFDSLLPDGSACGFLDAKPVCAFGALPGDTARVRIFKKRRGIRFGEVVEILRASPDRVDPAEAHFTSCSPWQVMRYDRQVSEKRKLLGEMISSAEGGQRMPERFYDVHSVESHLPQSLLGEEGTKTQTFGYRTKIEFSFTEENNELCLAFFARGSRRKVALPDGCALASDGMNRAARAIRDGMRAAGISAHQLKTLIIRESKSPDARVAALYVTDRSVAEATARLHQSLTEDEGLRGFRVIYSDPESPASIATETLHQSGSAALEEKVGEKSFRYAFDGFFQNHIPLFSAALGRMRAQAPLIHKLVDLYCGVGTIGISLADRAAEVVGIEQASEAIECARHNAQANGVKHFRGIACDDRTIPEGVLDGAEVVVCDPPRVGLHKNVITALVHHKPGRILYLSCNPATQARDYGLLKEHYAIASCEGFDFYPNTPHMESLMVLDAKN